MNKGLALVATFLLLTGCGNIRQETQPFTRSANDPHEICLIEDSTVRESFREAYKNDLAQKGFTVRVLPQGAAIDSCSLTSTYEAHWRWDLAMYLVSADLRVYRNGQLDGEATYDAKGAGLNTDKFIDADEKLQELTNHLFPR